MPISPLHLSDHEVVTLARCLDYFDPVTDSDQVASILKRSEHYRGIDNESIQAVILQIAKIRKESGKL